MEGLDFTQSSGQSTITPPVRELLFLSFLLYCFLSLAPATTNHHEERQIDGVEKPVPAVVWSNLVSENASHVPVAPDLVERTSDSLDARESKRGLFSKLAPVLEKTATPLIKAVAAPEKATAPNKVAAKKTPANQKASAKKSAAPKKNAAARKASSKVGAKESTGNKKAAGAKTGNEKAGSNRKASAKKTLPKASNRKVINKKAISNKQSAGSRKSGNKKSK